MVTIHGNQGSGLYAGMGAEVYGNTLNAPNNTGNPICMIMQRGGRMMVFDNTVNTPTTNVFTLVYDEFADSLNPTINQPQHPTDSYYWNNKRNGTTRFNAVIHDNWPTSVTENVDFWNQQTTFNGTVGMGVGLLANRPATCTVGVGYFATDVGPLGTFYKATAANTWTKYYEPYNEETPMFLSSNLFYNNSSFDGQSAAANVWDDAAIALDKTPLLPGQTASIDNYTSYSRGINGLMMNFANLPGTVTAADFTFKVGNSNTPETWAPAPVPTSITQRKVNGMDRVTVIWPDGAIAKQWLQVTVKATSNTGLKEDVVFYFGNAIGEVGNSTADAVVNASDESGIRANLASLTQAVITNHYDINRDGLVNATDQALVRANLASLNALRLITVPGAVKSSAISSALQEASLSDSAIDEATLSALAASAVQKTAATAVRQSTATEAALQTLDWNRLAAALSIAGNPLSGQGTSGFSFLNQSEED